MNSISTRQPAGWRHNSTWTYLVMLLFSVAALVISLGLSAETLQLARHPEAKLDCDVNAVVSCSWLGGLAALAYAYWLFSQSVFVIHALCLWCLGLMFSTTVQFMALTHATVTAQDLPQHDGRFARLRNGLNTYYRLNIDLMIDALWIVVLIAIIVLKEGPALF